MTFWNRLSNRLRFEARFPLKWSHDWVRLPLTWRHFDLYRRIHRDSYRCTGGFPELVNCRDYNDKIQWLKLFDQQPRTVLCSDKLGVRKVVHDLLGEGFIPDLYQVGDHVYDLDFDSLPKAFVLKTNHDSGTVELVRDKSTLDRTAIETRFEKALGTVFSLAEGEWAYAYIPPKVFVEEFIEPENPAPPADYKFHCVEGNMVLLQYITDRGLDPKEQMIDRNGRDVGFVFDHRFHHGDSFSKPLQWERMIEIAETLAAGFKYVRVDLYLSGDRILVGEMTFWPMAGRYRSDGQKTMGRYLTFDRSTVHPTCLHLLPHPRA
ncbi:MAG: ATP-grasp fold amidoligase family protein [Kiritimatiellae bacterium]|jgi:hypothetical protein|nr:ATP-grasp fold amidoligase family protein [Kiritimatiellia bacterium]MDD4341170.1 ATP-grasp fold amidoligase family protein [Kiritimatiellia bacterium]